MNILNKIINTDDEQLAIVCTVSCVPPYTNNLISATSRFLYSFNKRKQFFLMFL